MYERTTKRRGGARDDSTLNIGLNRRELDVLLERIRRKLESYRREPNSFATVLKRSGANIAYISESLGHSDLKTTENYLASFEREERVKNAELLTKF